ncbi:MAG: hypothetical protein LBN95_01215 [Prevotellaceae bacterium]|jgi:tetratricopeptide (TPR) repeat protein|nr:hypothetical protein [Prevotellaceae bacterium]
MQNNEISNIYEQIQHSLFEKRIATAFFFIKHLTTEIKDYNLTCRYDELVEFYSTMLNYRMSGIEDQNQKEILNHFLLDMFLFAQDVREKLYVKQMYLFEYIQLRNFLADKSANNELSFEKTPENLQIHYLDISVNNLVTKELASERKIAVFEKHQRVLGYLFHYIWLKTNLSNGELETVKTILKDENIGEDSKMIVVSALTLNALRYFDAKKITLLLDSAAEADMQLRQRCLIGFVLVFAKYGYLWNFDKNLRSQFLNFVSETGNADEIENIILQIIRTSETEKLTQHINEEIMPEMLRMTPIIKQKLKMKKDDSEENPENDDDENEKIPSWEELFEKNDSFARLQELGELQMSGSDIFVSAFAQMKNHPFFRMNENWFIPFSKDNVFVSELFNRRESFFTMILDNPAMCNSDKYSFALTLLQMPENELKNVESGIKAEYSQMKEIIDEKKHLEKDSEVKLAASLHIRDLYRFYTQFPKYQEFDNPLLKITNIINYDIFNEIFNSEKNIEKLAAAYFSQNHYNQALMLYLKIYDKDNPEVDICRKIGYCYQQKEMFKEALMYYFLADSLEKDNTWTLKRMAYCYKKTDDLVLAADCYRRALEITPDDFKLMFKQATCYINSNDFEKAMPILFKIDYLNPKYPKIKSALLLCAFCCGNLEKAAELAKKVADVKKPDVQDLMIAGNVALAQKNKRLALDYYNKALEIVKDLNAFMSMIQTNLEKMENIGVSLADVETVIETILMQKLPQTVVKNN